MTSNTKRLLLAELVLIVAGVFVFRGLWMLLDSLAVMHHPVALWVSLIAGLGASVWALHGLLRESGK
jgi:hypothetical protein